MLLVHNFLKGGNSLPNFRAATLKIFYVKDDQKKKKGYQPKLLSLLLITTPFPPHWVYLSTTSNSIEASFFFLRNSASCGIQLSCACKLYPKLYAKFWHCWSFKTQYVCFTSPLHSYSVFIPWVKNMGSRSSFRRWFQEVGKTVGEMEKGRELIKGMQKQVTGIHPNGDLWGAV